MNTPRIEGRVKFFNSEKGFGFIRAATGDKDIFFHMSAVANRVVLGENDVVQFTTTDGHKGPQATAIELIRKASFDKNQSRPQRDSYREQQGNRF